ncbi:MAG: hypothetical protein BGO26_06790 [Actinobacteria bacterium 69-20]|nr:hypothetical protein [Actinomycetota bacterium]OJV28141.1 MAG: hypothetical protein BGO26_06790 [Actinobacteria bacterium 69-20]
MSVKTRYTTTQSVTLPSWVRTCRAVAAGEQGAPYEAVPSSVSSVDGGGGAIISALFPVSGAVPVGIASRGGGAATAPGGKGGSATAVFDMLAGGGGGSGWEYQSGVSNGWRSGGGWGEAPGSPGGTGEQIYAGDTTSGGRGGGADGLGGAGGTSAGSTSGAAGQSNASGGVGGVGAARSGGAGGSGGGGFGGGGGGTVNAVGTDYVGSGGGAGSSTYGSGTQGAFLGVNRGAGWVDLYVAGAPKMPTPLSPVGNVWQDRTKPIVLAAQHNPDTPGDSIDAQTDMRFRHRKVGGASWATVTGLGLATSTAIAAMTYADGDQVEWQTATKADGTAGDDATGIWGAWSDSQYFRDGTPPSAPIVTSPAPGATIAVATVSPTWTAPGQVEYQARLTGDKAGAADESVIYSDTGPLTGTASTATLAGATNHVPAHVQVRVRTTAGGLWSTWADVPVSIEWAGPPKPVVTAAVDGARGCITVTVTNPAPVGVEPTADRIEIYVTENGVSSRRAILAPGDPWTYWTPVGDVGIEAVAIYTPTNVQTSSGVTW